MKPFFKISFIFIVLSSLISCDFKDSDSKEDSFLTAKQVIDESSLKVFVAQAVDHYKKDPVQAVEDFRNKEKWKHNSIYLFGVDDKGVGVFHVAKPSLETQDLSDLTDSNGVKIVQSFLDDEKNENVVEYLWDDPQKEAGEKSKKISYVIKHIKEDGTIIYIGSGFYPKPEDVKVEDDSK